MKFGSNIGGHMKKRSWENEIPGFIHFEVIIKKISWKATKGHISATKGSITSKNFEVFLRNLKTYKLSYWRFVESFKCVGEVGGDFLPKHWPPENTNFLDAERGLLECFVKTAN